MGYSRLGFKDTEPEVESISLTESFMKMCPIYMSYGMTYDEFWYDDVYKARFYLKAYKEKLKQKDMELWEQGMYVYEALLQVSPILRPFSKATKPLPYTEKPHLVQEQEKEEQPTEQQIETERLRAQIWLKNWVRSMKRNK